MPDKLAINGGQKAVENLGPYPTKIGAEELWQIVDMWDFEDSGVKEKLHALILGNRGVQGPHLFRYYNPQPSRVAAAEDAMAEFIGVKHCLAVNSCTSALTACYRALGIGAGDEVIVPAYTFFATAATVVTCNAIPVIVEVDESLNISPAAVERAISPRTKAIVPVHMRGAAAQMDAIMEIANRHGIPVVEDVAQAAGGRFKEQCLGSIGTMGCFSFDYYKIIVSGEGGFITTNDKWLHTRAQSWHDTAACWRPDRFAQERRDGELFCGENYRMSELEGAVALAQIAKADDLLQDYRRAKRLIKAAIEPTGGLTFRRLHDPEGDAATSLVMFIDNAEQTQRVLDALQAEGVPAGGVYDAKVRDWHIYAYWEHILQKKSVASDGLPWSAVPESELPKYSPVMCPQTLELLSRAVILDVNPHYTDDDCTAIANGINKVSRAILDTPSKGQSRIELAKS